MSRRSLLIASTTLLLAALVLFMPLRIAASGDGVAARKVEGILWDGSIRDLRVGRLAIGDVNARLKFWPLFLGRAQMLLSRGDAQFAPGIDGSVTRRPSGFSVDNMRASFPVGQFFAPLPAQNIELQDFSVRFAAGRCVTADGTIRLTLPSGIPGFDVANGMLGKPRCSQGDLLMPLSSQSAMERIDIRVKVDGSYSATIFLSGDRLDQAAALGLAGFRAVPGGQRMVVRGRL